MQPAVDHDRRRAGAVAEAVDRLEREPPVRRGLVEIHPQAALGMLGEPLRAHGLACLGPAQAHGVRPGRRAPEVVVKRDHAMNLGAREVEPLGNQGHRGWRNVTEGRLNSMQHLQQRAGAPLQVLDDAPDGIAPGRGQSFHVSSIRPAAARTHAARAARLRELSRVFNFRDCAGVG